MMRTAVTLATALLAALVAEIAVPRVGGVAPDLVALTVVAVGRQRGPEAGALYGFVAGLAVDLFLTTPAGLTAAALTIVGYAAGSMGGRVGWWQWLPAGALTALAAGGLYLGLAILVGEDQLARAHTLLVLLAESGLTAIVAPAVVPIAGRAAGRAAGAVRAKAVVA